ncbi:ThiJ/PfpI domain-containing protein [Mycena epipterygia]|nr:ThiJ/PfpI domain-containing protein [Mycena epipterygia]
MPSVLFVFTSASRTLTGWYLPEATHLYYLLAPHTSIHFASPTGPNPPLAEQSIKAHQCVKFLADETVRQKLVNAAKLSDVNAADYDAIFYVWPVVNLTSDPANIKLGSEFYCSGKMVGVLCHGPAAPVGITDAEGKSIFAGKSVMGFSNAEEILLNGVKDVPFLLEDRIISLGGAYTKVEKLFGVNVVVDGNLCTGQNPAPPAALGQAMWKVLQSSRD